MNELHACSSRLLNRELVSFDDVDALGQAVLGCADGGVRCYKCALCVIDINGGTCGLELVDACLDVFEAGDAGCKCPAGRGCHSVLPL